MKKIAILSLALLASCGGTNPGLVRNPEALDTLGPDDDSANPSILICRLR